MTLKNWGAVKKETVSGAGAEAVSGSWHKSKRSSQITGRAICSHARRGCSPRHGSTLLFLPCPLTQADNSNRRVQILDGADGSFLAKVCVCVWVLVCVCAVGWWDGGRGSWEASFWLP